LIWVCPCFSLFWALCFLVVGILPLGLMSGVCIVVFVVHFRYISCVILTCPPINDESLKLVELVSYKPYLLSFGICLYGFYVKLVGENWS
jgi:uncharacterized protein YneF (UPF0154 family)